MYNLFVLFSISCLLLYAPTHSLAKEPTVTILIQHAHKPTPHTGFQRIFEKALSREKKCTILSGKARVKQLRKSKLMWKSCATDTCHQKVRKTLGVSCLIHGTVSKKSRKRPARLTLALYSNTDTKAQIRLSSFKGESLADFARRAAWLAHQHLPLEKQAHCDTQLAWLARYQDKLKKQCRWRKKAPLCLPYRSHTRRNKARKTSMPQLHLFLSTQRQHTLRLCQKMKEAQRQSLLHAQFRVMQWMPTQTARLQWLGFLHLIERPLTEPRPAWYPLWKRSAPSTRRLSEWMQKQRAPLKGDQKRLPSRIEELTDAGFVFTASRLLQRWQRTHPIHTLTVQQLWKLAQLHEEHGKRKRAFKLYAQIIQHHPRWKHANRVRYSAAQLAESQRKYTAALRLYRTLSPSRDKHSKQVYEQAQLRIADLLEKTKQKIAAAEAYYQFYQRFSRSKRAAKALFRAARLYEQLGETRKAMAHFQTFLYRYQADRRQAHLVLQAHIKVVMEQLGPEKYFFRSRRLYRILNKSIEDRSFHLTPEQLEDVRPYLAKAYYRFAHFYYKEFKELKVNSNDLKVQRRQLSMKIQEYEEVGRRLEKLKTFPLDHWKICGKLDMAEGKWLIAQDIQKMPLPVIPNEKWTPKSITLYKTKLKSLYIDPLRRQSIQLYVELLKQAGNRKDTCVQQAIRAFKRLQPKRPLPRVQKQPPKPRKRHRPRRKRQRQKHLTKKKRFKKPVLPREYKLLHDICIRGQAASCEHLGLTYESRGTRGAYHARRYHALGCLLGNAKSCYFLGRLYMSGRGGKKNVTSGIKALERGCRRLHLKSCQMLRNHHKRSQDFVGQCKLWTARRQACHLSASHDCAALARRSRHPDIQAGFPRLEQRYLHKACQLGHRRSCRTAPLSPKTLPWRPSTQRAGPSSHKAKRRQK